MLEFNFSPFPVLETNRLVLRQITRDDADFFFTMRSEPRGLTYVDRKPPASMDEIYALFERIGNGIAANEMIAWVLVEKESKECVGTISFHKTYKEHHRAEMGYHALVKHWNKGFISEAIVAVIDYGFSQMKLHSIEAHVNPGNEVSIHLLEKNGFVREAYFKENYYFNGKFLDTPVYSLLTNR